MNGFPELDDIHAQEYLIPPLSLSDEDLILFQDRILAFYTDHKRHFAWRETSDPYRILLSEVMLQQTQTSRVEPKYEEFLSLWPDFSSLSTVSNEMLLSHWKGLGYNRRALNLKKAARMTECWNWTIPNDAKLIIQMPGVGESTTAALLSFCYNEKSIYLETNIRRVLLTCFYDHQSNIHDKELKALLHRLSLLTDDMKNWYYALMDYGVLLKNLFPNANVRSAHYTKQTKFENSNRQIRGQLIHLLTDTGAKDLDTVYRLLPHFEEERIYACLLQLSAEGFVQECESVYKIRED